MTLPCIGISICAIEQVLSCCRTSVPLYQEEKKNTILTLSDSRPAGFNRKQMIQSDIIQLKKTFFGGLSPSVILIRKTR
jgi:hypothetical protein